ncbi:RNA polymerase sigma factor [Cellulophaga sp. 20_2_10]|uniref:RNA polymerase sigma factor n=1 Tax=Cellulophaga sp. 20_2_10 TaxID=2942476 RepID=UPI00201AAD83|nr:RNA polymerase sigma factor [Cellulophaga sp. 20_2_10]MCL5245918.1 RNA polymerase sigma factor [Cellulophaga sp. 20_2_10]
MFTSDIITKCKANNRKAQMQLYKQYCNGMYCVAMRFLKNEDDAQDVVQEAFINAFQKMDQFSGDVTFGAWLKKIVVHKCLDFIKANKDKHLELTETSLRVVEDNNWLVEDTVTLPQIKFAIAQLPAKYKCVVQLYLIEGYDHSETSGILSITESACRTRLLRGKGLLKELLKEKRYGTGS